MVNWSFFVAKTLLFPSTRLLNLPCLHGFAQKPPVTLIQIGLQAEKLGGGMLTNVNRETYYSMQIAYYDIHLFLLFYAPEQVARSPKLQNNGVQHLFQ